MFKQFFLMLLILIIALYIRLVNPWILLKVPKVGFILYGLAGGPPVPYIDNVMFQYPHLWKKPNDVILAVPTKGGTTWLMTTLYYLRDKGKVKPYRDIYEEVRWLDFSYYPGQTPEERGAILRNASENYPFAIYKTHLFPPQIPFWEDTKYIICIRNVPDSTASLKSFFASHQKKFAEMWGGFPPQAGVPFSNKEEKAFMDFALKDIGSGRSAIDVLILDIIKHYWGYRHKKNVLFIHFTDRLRSDEKQIEKIAKFLDISVTSEEISGIAKAVSFDSMKKEAYKYDLRHVLDQFKPHIVPSDLWVLEKEMLIASGPNRKASEELSPEFVQKIREHVRNEVGPEIEQWINDADGPMPDVEIPKDKLYFS